MDIALHMLDLGENSIKAKADRVDIEIHISAPENIISLTIKDNGAGITGEKKVLLSDPLYFPFPDKNGGGKGLTLFKKAVFTSGGKFTLISEKDKGTEVYGSFRLSGTRPPLGELPEAFEALLLSVSEGRRVDFSFLYRLDGDTYKREFRFSTENMEHKEDAPADLMAAARHAREFIRKNIEDTNKNMKGICL